MRKGSGMMSCGEELMRKGVKKVLSSILWRVGNCIGNKYEFSSVICIWHIVNAILLCRLKSK